MRFKKCTSRIITVYCSFVLMLCACSEDDSTKTPANSNYDINSIAELSDFMRGINFEVTLSDGKVVEFTPREVLTESGTNSFTDEDGGFQFTDQQGSFSTTANNGTAKLRFEKEEYTFDLVICTTINELKWKYPDLTLSPYYDDLLIYIAVEFDNYSESEVVHGDHLFVVNSLHLVVDDRFGNAPVLNGDFYAATEERISLQGDVEENEKGLHGSGSAYTLIYNYTGYLEIFYSDFSLELTCGTE